MSRITEVILIADEVNANQRIYPKSVLEKIVEYYKDKPLFGQIGMPAWPMTSIDFSKAAFRCENFRMNDNELICDIEPLKSYHGELLERLMNTTKLSYASIGIGTITNDGIVCDDFRMTGLSAIAEPNWSFSKIGKSNDNK